MICVRNMDVAVSARVLRTMGRGRLCRCKERSMNRKRSMGSLDVRVSILESFMRLIVTANILTLRFWMKRSSFISSST